MKKIDIKKTDRRHELMGVCLTGKSSNQLLDWLEDKFDSQSKEGLVVIVTPNPEQVVEAKRNDRFRHILNESTIAIPDGVGLVFAAKLLGKGRVERIPGREFGLDLVKTAAEMGEKVVFLGGRLTDDQISKLKFQISNKYQIPNLKLKYLRGVEDIKNETEREREEVLEEIGKIKPGLLLVGYGAPWQEYWVWDNREALEKAGVKVAMVVGGAFDVWAGKVKAAPELVSRVGLEWLWRLANQPWRWKRQLRIWWFGVLVLGKVLSRKR